MWQWTGRVIMLALLTVYTVQDIRERQIRWRIGAAVILAGLLSALFRADQGILRSFGGMSLGAGLFLVSFVSHGAVGEGDAVAVTACGAWLGLSETFQVLFSALLLAAVYALILLARGKGREAKFPFMPFLLAAQILCCIMQGIS